MNQSDLPILCRQSKSQMAELSKLLRLDQLTIKLIHKIANVGSKLISIGNILISNKIFYCSKIIKIARLNLVNITVIFENKAELHSEHAPNLHFPTKPIFPPQVDYNIFWTKFYIIQQNSKFKIQQFSTLI